MLNLFVFLFPLMVFSYPKSDHYDGEKFFLPWGDDLKGFWSLVKWKATASTVPWPSQVPIKNHPFRPLAPSEASSVTWINHATFLLQFPGVTVLTDPVFSERVSPVSFAGPKRVHGPGLALDSLPPVDVVIISHNHYDHLDLEALKLIDARFHPLFLVPLGDEELLKRAGIQTVKALDWWEDVRVKDVRFVFAPAQHWSSRKFWDKNKSLWGSYVIESGARKIYFAGDTGYGPHFRDIKSRLGTPDLALLPIGAYKPRWFMKYYHMDPEEAVRAHLDLGAKLSVGMHFGTFQLTDEGIDEPVRDLKLALPKHRVPEEAFVVLDPGQSLPL